MGKRGESAGVVRNPAKAMGSRLRDARRAVGLEVHDVAERLGCRAQAVYRWEVGATSPRLFDLVDLAELYDCSIDSLVGVERPARRKAS